MLVGSIDANTVKILFNTNKEELLTGDILKIVNQEGRGVISQVFNIGNSRKIPANNIASTRILLTIKPEGVFNWEGNVPSKEFKASKLTDTEIQSCINIQKPERTIFLGSLSRFKGIKLEADPEEFKAPFLIIGNDPDQRISTAINITHELVKNAQKTVILDFNREFSDIKNSERLFAGKSFKLPLDLKGIEAIYEKITIGLPADTRIILEDIFSNITDYLSSDGINFLSFANLREVIEEEYKENKIPEIILLRNFLEKLDKQGIYANSESEVDSFWNYMNKNNLLVVDFSNIPENWHVNFINYIVDTNISRYRKHFSLIFEADDRKINEKTIETLYPAGIKSGISPLICLSYYSKHLDSIVNRSNNFILFNPGINSFDFKDLSIFLSTLDNKKMVIYGKITNNIAVLTESGGHISTKEKVVSLIEEPKPVEEILFVEKKANPLDFEAFEEAGNEEETIPEGYENLESLFTDESHSEPVIKEEEYSFNQEGFGFSEEELNFEYSVNEIEDFSYLDNDTEKEEALPIQPEESVPEQDTFNLVMEMSEAKDGDEFSLDYETPPPSETEIDIPVYAAEESIESDLPEFSEGDHVSHEKYGSGKISKIINYGNKILLSIQFEDVGRRLLDPQLAVIQKVL